MVYPLLLLPLLAGPPLEDSPPRTQISVLAPLAYGPKCWSQIELSNLGAAPVVARAEGHKGSGALVGLAGRPVALKLAPGETVQLRLQPPGEESLEGWVKVEEILPDTAPGPSLAIGARSECVVNDRLETVPREVAYTMRNPWLAFDLAESPGRVALVLNLAAEAAEARLCYSKGTNVSVPNSDGTGSRMAPVCSETRLLQIPPFASASVAVEYDGNTQFSIQTSGESLILRVLLPLKPGLRTYVVDSTIQFGEVLEPKH
jgi:hypothetical protein